MPKLIWLGMAIMFLSIGPARAIGVCSTGHYATCVTCCASNPQITNPARCNGECSQIKDSPLSQQLRAAKEKAAQH